MAQVLRCRNILFQLQRFCLQVKQRFGLKNYNFDPLMFLEEHKFKYFCLCFLSSKKDLLYHQSEHYSLTIDFSHNKKRNILLQK